MRTGRLGWEPKAVDALAAELVEGLTGLGRPAEAAGIAAHRLNDIDGAVYLFCQAHEWRQVVQKFPQLFSADSMLLVPIAGISS
jgi:hypothetical protein